MADVKLLIGYDLNLAGLTIPDLKRHNNNIYKYFKTYPKKSVDIIIILIRYQTLGGFHPKIRPELMPEQHPRR